MGEQTATRPAWTVKEIAADLSVSPSAVMRWIEGGHLVVFRPPGVDIHSSNKGPKTLRVLDDDYQAFKRRNCVTGRPQAEPEAPAPVRRTASAVPAGPDGKTRSKRWKGV